MNGQNNLPENSKTLSEAEKIIYSNGTKLSRSLSELFELLLYNMDEAASLMVCGCGGAEDFIGCYRVFRDKAFGRGNAIDAAASDDGGNNGGKGNQDSFGYKTPADYNGDSADSDNDDGYLSDVPYETYDCVFGEDGNRRAAALAYFCRAVCDKSAKNGRPVQLSDFFRDAADSGSGSVAYMKNAYSDEAYRVFSAAINNSPVTYLSGFPAVCEEVYYGRAKYCILPYETSDEGMLSGICRLMRKYELTMHLLCPVQCEKNITKFALCGRNSSEKINVPDTMKSDKYIRISIDSPDRFGLPKLHTAADVLGIRYLKSESVPVSWDRGRYGCALTFETGQNDPCPFLLYTALELPPDTEITVYSEILR